MNYEIITLDTATLKKILRSRNKLEAKLKVKLEAKAGNLVISGEELDLFVAKRIIEAIEKKFPLAVALLLLEEDYTIEEIPIKAETRKKNLERIRGRIIGKEGKTLQIISELTDCYLALYENIVSIIGTFEKIKIAENAVKSLIHGAKQANVYSYSEQARARFRPEKIEFKPIKVKKNKF